MLIQFVLSSAPPPPAAPAAPAAQGSPQERDPKRDAKGGLGGVASSTRARGGGPMPEEARALPDAPLTLPRTLTLPLTLTLTLALTLTLTLLG